MGVYSSAHCVPMAQRVDAAKKFMWANVCVASSVFKDKKLSYVFRPQVHSDQFGEASCSFVAENAKDKLKTEPKNLRVAIIYEDGPYGAGVAQGNEAKCKELGMNIVLKEGYAATAPDLSSLVTKLRRARPDVLLHTGYNPDITLFLRQSREQGLKFKAIIGHGAGYGQIGKLMETFGKDVNYVYNVDPVAAQLLDAKSLKPGLGELTKEMVKRYQAQKGPADVPPHASMGFNQSWIFFTDVLPRAIKKHGGIDAEALRKASLETDIPLGGTIQGYGVKFFPPGHAMAGQNERSSPVVMQYVDGKTYIGAGPSPLPSLTATRDLRCLPFPRRDNHSADGHDRGRLFDCCRGQRPHHALRRLRRRLERLLQSGRRRDPRPDRPERLGQEHHVQCRRRPLRPERRLGALEGRGDRRLPPAAVCHRGIARTFQIPRPFRRLSLLENVALAAFYGSGKHPSRKKPGNWPEKRSISSSCRRTRRRASKAWARRG